MTRPGRSFGVGALVVHQANAHADESRQCCITLRVILYLVQATSKPQVGDDISAPTDVHSYTSTSTLLNQATAN